MAHTLSSDSDDDLPDLSSRIYGKVATKPNPSTSTVLTSHIYRNDTASYPTTATSSLSRQISTGSNIPRQADPIEISDSSGDEAGTTGANNAQFEYSCKSTDCLPSHVSYGFGFPSNGPPSPPPPRDTDYDSYEEDAFLPVNASFNMDTVDTEPLTMNNEYTQPTAATHTSPKPANKRKKKSPEELAEAKRAAELKKRQKEEEKERKRLEKEEKAREKENETRRKKFIQEKKRCLKAKECMKYMTVMLDNELVRKSCGAAILGEITEKEMRHEIQRQPHPNLISFLREVPEPCELPGNRFEVVKREVVEDQLLLWLSADEFMDHVRAQCQNQYAASAAFMPTKPLRSFLQELRTKLEDRKITLIVQGLLKYFKSKAKGRQDVTRIQVEEVQLDIQFTTGCIIQFTETDKETAELVFCYTKSVAERPGKQDRLDNITNMHIDTSKSVKIDSDGAGITAAWRQIIQIFKGISAGVANAIMAQYPTPRSLYEVYQTCSSEKEGIRVLEDINVRRGEGVLETNRRVGPELAKKMYILFTTMDPDMELK